MDKESIQNRIYRMRGKQVMLDYDLAFLYQVETKALKRAVRRNIERFPVDFMFQLSGVEYESLRRQIGTLKRGEHAKYPPYAFTEQGVAMLSSVLHSRRAIRVNIEIIRTFVQLRHAILSSRDIARRVEKLEGKVYVHDTDIRLIFDDVGRLKKRFIAPDPIDPTVL